LLNLNDGLNAIIAFSLKYNTLATQSQRFSYVLNAPRSPSTPAPLPQNLSNECTINSCSQFLRLAKKKISRRDKICLAIVARRFYHGTLRKFLRRPRGRHEKPNSQPPRKKKAAFAPPEE